MRPYKLNINVPLQEHDAVDLQLIVEGLSKLFIKYLYKHSTNSAAAIFNMLITHLDHHYKQPIVLEHLHLVRLVVRIILNIS